MKFPSEFTFFPRTWMLPSDGPQFRVHLAKPGPSIRPFIVKPEASCQGKGIFITIAPQTDIPLGEHCVVQEYLNHPCLMDGLKFDLRIYVLVAGVDPLRIFLYEDGLTRLATEPYKEVSEDNLQDMCMHLTNYAINKHSEQFVQNEDADKDNVGHKRSLKYALKYLSQRRKVKVEKLWHDIKDIIIKTLISAQPWVCQTYRSC